MNKTILDAVAHVFQYPLPRLLRRHGPRGYANYQSYKPWLRDEFRFQCAYCLCREIWEPNGADGFSVEHWEPRSTHPERGLEYENLLYACCTCNASRQETPLPVQPLVNSLGDHLEIGEDAILRARTVEGEKVIEICRLNRASLVSFRRRLLRVLAVLAAEEHPEAKSALQKILGFPDDLPDLARRKPPGGNSKPNGITDCYFAQRKRGELAEVY